MQMAQRMYSFVGVDDTFHPNIIRKVNKENYACMFDQARNMLREAYQDQIDRFQAMTSRNLSHWLVM